MNIFQSQSGGLYILVRRSLSLFKQKKILFFFARARGIESIRIKESRRERAGTRGKERKEPFWQREFRSLSLIPIGLHEKTPEHGHRDATI